MPRKGTQSITMYTTNEAMLRAAFERVHKHFGAETYSRSGVLADLVRRKDEEIRDSHTRRDQIAAMREDLNAMRMEIAELKRMVQEMTHGSDYDHA